MAPFRRKNGNKLLEGLQRRSQLEREEALLEDHMRQVLLRDVEISVASILLRVEADLLLVTSDGLGKTLIVFLLFILLLIGEELISDKGLQSEENVFGVRRIVMREEPGPRLDALEVVTDDPIET